MNQGNMADKGCPNTVKVAVLENQYATVEECVNEVKVDIKWIRSHMALKKDVDQEMSSIWSVLLNNIAQGGTIGLVIVILSKSGVL